MRDIIGIKNGDLEIGDSSEQQFILAMQSGPGHFIENPNYGVDVPRYLNGPPQHLRLEGDIRKTLDADGWRVDSIAYREDGYPIVVADPPA